jgi:hypothetical protein
MSLLPLEELPTSLNVTTKRREFARECAIIKGDLGSAEDQSRLDALCVQVGIKGHIACHEMPQGNYSGRDEFIPALEAVASFVRAN